MIRFRILLFALLVSGCSNTSPPKVAAKPIPTGNSVARYFATPHYVADISNPKFDPVTGFLEIQATEYRLEQEFDLPEFRNESNGRYLSISDKTPRQNYRWTTLSDNNISYLKVSGLGLDQNIKNDLLHSGKIMLDLKSVANSIKGGGQLTITCATCDDKVRPNSAEGINIPSAPSVNTAIRISISDSEIAVFKRQITKDEKERHGKQAEKEIAARKEQERIQKEGDGSPDDLTCKKYGFKPNTENYAQCRLQIDIARKEAAQKQAAYDEQKRQYDAQVAAVEKERERRQASALMEFGLRLMGGQSPANAAVSVGTGAPSTPPTPPMTNQTYMLPGGRMMNCTTAGSITNCY